MLLICIKDIYWGFKREIAFKAEKKYHAVIGLQTIKSINEFGDLHILFDKTKPEDWNWFCEHFQ